MSPGTERRDRIAEGAIRAFHVLALLLGLALIWFLPSTPVPGLLLTAVSAFGLYRRVCPPGPADESSPESERWRDDLFDWVDQMRAESNEHYEERRRRGDFDPTPYDPPPPGPHDPSEWHGDSD